MSRRFLLGALLGCACEAAVELPPGWHEATAMCAADAPPEVIARRVPDQRFKEALAAAEKVVASRDMKIATEDYAAMDLRRREVFIRTSALAVGVTSCPLADKLQEQADATPGPRDLADTVKVLEALQATGPEYFVQVLAAGCAEIASCGRECAPGLTRAATVPPHERARALAAGCAAFGTKDSLGEAGVVSFTRARVTDFLNVGAPLFDPPAAARVQELRARLEL